MKFAQEIFIAKKSKNGYILDDIFNVVSDKIKIIV